MSAQRYIPKWELDAEKRRKKSEEEDKESRRKYALDHTVVLFAPFAAESGAVSRWSGDVPVITPSDLGGYVYCSPNPPNSFWAYWSIFPKPIGFVKTLPDWITEEQFKREMIGYRPKLTTPWLPASPGVHAEWSRLANASDRLRHSEREQKIVDEWDSKNSRRINYEYKDFVAFQTREGRKFTSQELEEILRNNAVLERRSNLYPTSSRLELDVGLNPVGVRQFFETQIFSNPPGVEFTPALLKPYMLSFKRIYDIDLTKPPYKSGKKEVPVALYSGLYYGDTCCGKVFDMMFTADEVKRLGNSFTHTFNNDEERNAFFLQICKMVIDGIDKDGDRRQDCVNHGNYGDCIVDFFKTDSNYDCYKIRSNDFIRDRVIMLLFHKVIEANEKVREIIELQKMKSVMVKHTLDVGPAPAPPRKRNEQAMMKGILTPTIHTGKSESHDSQIGRYEALLNRYFYIIITIMINSENITRNPNPLNIELCSAETELVPSAPDSEGRVRYVANFVKSRNPDGRTMAHLLAERCPRILRRLMVDPQIRDFFVLKFDDKDNVKYQKSTGVWIEPSQRFIPNPIAYSIPDVNGDTPRSLAIAQLTEAVANARFRDLHRVESIALEFFSSLPEPQPERVFVEREQFMKRKMFTSKIRSVAQSLPSPDENPAVYAGIRKLVKSRRDFEDASEMEGLLSGRDTVSLMTGPQSALLTGGPPELVIPPRFGRTRTIEGPPGPPDYATKPGLTIVPNPQDMGGGRRSNKRGRDMKKRRKFTRKQRRTRSCAGRIRKM